MDIKKKETAGIILRAVVAMILFVIAIVNYDKLSGLDVEALLSQFDKTGIIIAVVLGLYFVKGLIFVLPASVIYVAVGVILDTWLAVGVNVLGIVIEILAAYFLGRFLGKDYVHRLLSKKEAGRKILATNFQDKKWLIFVTRLLPVFPIDFLSLFFGATKSNGVMHFVLSVAGLLLSANARAMENVASPEKRVVVLDAGDAAVVIVKMPKGILCFLLFVFHARWFYVILFSGIYWAV